MVTFSLTNAARMSKTNPFDNVGRAGELHSLVSKPELNGVKVDVGMYSTANLRYAVSSTSYNGKPFTISVKIDNINFLDLATFDDRYGDAPIVEGSFDKTVEAGTVVEFLECPEYTKKLQSWLLKQPSFIRGVSTQLNELGYPTLLFSRAVVISVEDALDEPIVFSHINFDIPSKEGAGHCARSRNVTFRHCRFRSLGNGFSIGDRNRLGDNAGRARVTFEDCIFEGCEAGAGLLVAGDGHAVLRRCVFRSNRTGVEVKDGGSVVLVDCTVQDSLLTGMHLHSQGRSVDVLNCTVERSAQHGLLAADGSTARMHNVTVRQCEGSGVHVTGGASSTTVMMDNSALSQCLRGLTAVSGKVKVAVNVTKVYDNTEYGVCVEESSIGEVNLSGCEVKDNSKQEILCEEGGKCGVVIDGEKYIQ